MNNSMEEVGSCTNFKTFVASSYQQKLAVLEERDKYLKETVFKGKGMERIRFTGTCPDMCPEKERLKRELNCSFSTYESVVEGNERHIVPELVVKEYVRSSADQDDPLPHDLRPEPVLVLTMDYLINEIMCRADTGDENISELYTFCWDRLRAIRKDIIQQRLCSPRIITILEQSARFHIWAYDKFGEQDKAIFDERINTENLINCLQMLIQMYEKLLAVNIRCQNEIEFRTYMALMQFNVPDLMWLYGKFPQYVQSSSSMKEAVALFIAYRDQIYARFFTLVENTTYLNSCILLRYFNAVRFRALVCFIYSYCPMGKPVRFPLSVLKDRLMFDTMEDTEMFVRASGFVIDKEKQFVVSRSSVRSFSSTASNRTSTLVKNKRLPLMDIIGKTTSTLKKKDYKVHCSFSQYDILNCDAYDALDQKKKLKLYYNYIAEDADVLLNRAKLEQQARTSTKVSSGATDIEMKDTKPIVAPLRKVSPQFIVSQTLPVQFKPPPPLVSVEHIQKNCPYTKSLVRNTAVPSVVDFKFGTKFSSPVDTNIASGSFRNGHIKNTHNVLQDEFSNPPSINLPDPLQVNSPVRDEPNFMQHLLENMNQGVGEFRLKVDEFQSQHNIVLEPREKKQTNPEIRNLRKVVKRKLKRGYAKKYGKFWRDKVRSIQNNKWSNIADITYLSVEEHIQLWGTPNRPVPDNVTERFQHWNSTSHRVNKMLSSDAMTPNFIGNKIANHIATRTMLSLSQSAFPIGTIPWKCLVSVPEIPNDNFKSFFIKLKDICTLSFYSGTELGSVQTLYTPSGIKVLTVVNVETGIPKVGNSVYGVNGVVFLLSDKWESMEDAFLRINSIIRSQISQPFPVTILIMTDLSYRESLKLYLESAKQNNYITSWDIRLWKSYFTICETVSFLSQQVAAIPPIMSKKLPSFLENVTTDFFLTLSVFQKSSPNMLIDSYNKMISRLKGMLLGFGFNSNFYLAAEFLPYMTNQVDNDYSEDLYNQQYICNLFDQFQLPRFKKWPPCSFKKLVKLIKTFCDIVDKNQNMLLPSVLRLLNPSEEINVTDTISHASWTQIVELWAKYNISTVQAKYKNIDKISISCKNEDIYNLTTDLQWLGNDDYSE